MKANALLSLCCSILAGVSGLAACERPNTEPASYALSGSAGQPARESDDEAITARVKAKLAADAELLPLPIAVETDHGRVTLSGVVPQALIGRAVQVVGSVSGVRAVVSRLEAAAAS